MLRYRTVAAAPVRSASATWQIITDLVADTIAASGTLTRSDAMEAMAAAAPAGRMLIAGGHLDRHPLTLVAGSGPLRDHHRVGHRRADHRGEPQPDPRRGRRETYTIYLPAPAPLAAVVAAARRAPAACPSAPARADEKKTASSGR